MNGRLAVRGLLAPEIAAVWPRARPLVLRGLAHADGRYQPADVYARLLDRRMQLWIAEDGDRIAAICVTEVIDYPRQRRCNLFLCAGRERQRWLAGLAEIEAWARTRGCEAIELQARPGWKRVLTDYRTTHLLMRKELKR